MAGVSYEAAIPATTAVMISADIKEESFAVQSNYPIGRSEYMAEFSKLAENGRSRAENGRYQISFYTHCGKNIE